MSAWNPRSLSKRYSFRVVSIKINLKLWKQVQYSVRGLNTNREKQETAMRDSREGITS